MPWFEDFAVGQVRRFGPREVTREEILAFARAYDPQPFHLSEEDAAKTHFGRLAASGWHTAGLSTRMIVDTMAGNMEGNLGALGIDAMRFLKPVHPGDVLTVEAEVIEARHSRSRPFGIVKTRITVSNQDGEPVLTYEPIGLYKLRAGQAAAE